MKTEVVVGMILALATGIAIGTQATLSSRIGSVIGEIRTGLLTNLMSGLVAALLLLGLLLLQGRSTWDLSSPVIIMLIVSGSLGILIITGVSFSLQRTGVAAGLATIILGQLLVSAIVDSRGLGGVDPIPLTLQRVLGFLTMVVAVFLLIPRE